MTFKNGDYENEYMWLEKPNQHDSNEPAILELWIGFLIGNMKKGSLCISLNRQMGEWHVAHGGP